MAGNVQSASRPWTARSKPPSSGQVHVACPSRWGSPSRSLPADSLETLHKILHALAPTLHGSLG